MLPPAIVDTSGDDEERMVARTKDTDDDEESLERFVHPRGQNGTERRVLSKL